MTVASQVRDGVWRFTDPLGPVAVHSYLVLGERTALVDAGLPGAAARAAALLQELGRRPQLDWVLLTHSHWDHVGATAEHQGAGARVAVHVDGVATVEDASRSWDELFGRFPALYEAPPDVRRRFEAGLLDGVRVDRSLHAGDLIDLGGGVVLDVVGAPGHTRDSVLLRWRAEGVWFLGDTPAGGRPGVPAPYEDAAAYQTTLRKLRGERPDLALPGHGDPLDADAFAEVTEAALALSFAYGACIDEARRRGIDDLEGAARALCDEFDLTWSAHVLLSTAAHLQGAQVR